LRRPSTPLHELQAGLELRGPGAPSIFALSAPVSSSTASRWRRLSSRRPTRSRWSRVRLSTLSSEACTRALSAATFCALETLFLPAVEIRCKNSGTEYVYTSFEGPECGPS
jgi:hypothetical protein